MTVRALTLMALLGLGAPVAAAQEIRGSVSDASTGVPVTGAVVVVIDADSAIRAATVSDTEGAFSLRFPPIDWVRLSVVRLGYGRVESVPLSFAPGDSLRLEIRLRPQAVALAGVTVTVPQGRNHRRFLSRQASGFGVYFGPEDIAMLPRMPTNLVLSALPGTWLFPDATGRGLWGKPTGQDGFCSPTVYVDGWEVEGSLEASVSKDTLRGIEIYRNPINAPLDLPGVGSACMVVALWTDLGFNW